MRATSTSIALVILLSVSDAWAAPMMPRAVRHQIDEAKAACGGSLLPLARDAVVAEDLTGDGIVEWIVNETKFHCKNGPASMFEGSHGGLQAVFLGLPNGEAKIAFELITYGRRLERTRAGVRLWLPVAGALCGPAEPIEAATRKLCERPLVWNSKTGVLDFDDLSSTRPLADTLPGY